MKIVFRTDASLQIGTGHVMRCLTLADVLTAKGANCEFICRAHEGNLIDFIRSKGYIVHSLAIMQRESIGINPSATDTTSIDLAHAHWLGATQEQDVEACAPILVATRPDWLIIDHYGLDARWERDLAPYYHRLMVIDDLADRPHACNLLLDQTFGRAPADYRPLVPANSSLLCGSQYAMLRPEFSALRPYSLQRRAHPALRELLITMGGVDKDNATSQVLQALHTSALPVDCRITVVMGRQALWLDEVRTWAHAMSWPTQVVVGISDMAQLMVNSDLAIGAGGATSWERCCLGLPTAMIVLAENQHHAALLLKQAKSAHIIEIGANLKQHLAEFIDEVSTSETCLTQLCDNSSKVTDGKGCERVANWLLQKEEKK